MSSIDSNTNILKAINNISKNKQNDLSKIYSSEKSKDLLNRANNMGEALELFVKDSFCNTFDETGIIQKHESYSLNFSYLGNQNNPPDLIIRKGDAVEVKKIDGLKVSDLALNSSYPKSKLYSNSPMITESCRNCEMQDKKDIIYTIGLVDKYKLRILTFIYGDCYAADKKVYEKIKEKVSEGLIELDLDLAKTKELGRVNRVDPLGITNLRIRGMWTIKNPLNVFSDIFDTDIKHHRFILIALMRKIKYLGFKEKDRKQIEQNKDIRIESVKIQDPDNSAKLIDAILLKVIVL